MQASKRGFTLIEILVVVVIIGITLGFALLAFGDFGGKRRIKVAAEYFVDFVGLVRQQAIFESTTLGLKINKNSYQALRFSTQRGWQAFSQKGIFRVRYFPDNSVVDLDAGGKVIGAPEIIIQSSGDMTPFKLYIGTVKEYRVVTILGTYDGTVTLQSSTK